MQHGTTKSLKGELSAAEKKQRARASKALSNARQRCSNMNHKDYGNYGGQGIKVLIGLEELIACIGLPKAGYSLDRIDPHGHYETGNLRWATKSVQAANKKASLAGSVTPIQSLIAQQKMIVEEENKRLKVTDAWHLLVKAFNVGSLSRTDNDRLARLLGLSQSPIATFGRREVVVNGTPRVILRLPSLTLPSGLVDLRGPLRPAHDEEHAQRYIRHGLVYGLFEQGSAANVPATVRTAMEELRVVDDRPGLTLVGRPSEGDLASGWFEVWMLAAASRLPSLNLTTAFFPAITCTQLLKQLGSPNNWVAVCHPLLDVAWLFIPDFQLDCGPWGFLSPYQFGMLERLLSYRSEMGHKTIVGIQSPHKLSAPLRKLLLGNFRVEQIENGTTPVSTGSSLAQSNTQPV